MMTEVHNLKGEESALYREPIKENRWRDLWTVLESRLSVMDKDRIQLEARRIGQGIQSLDATMTRYCELTCPSCEDPCCTGLKVFFNQADLLYLLGLGKEIPPGQTRAKAGEPCRYLTPDGCRLPRILRPYVCVWFLCEAQMELFNAESGAFQRQFIKTMQNIRACRLTIEALYEYHFPPGKTTS